MENYSFNLNGLVVSGNSILREVDAKRFYSVLQGAYLLLAICFALVTLNNFAEANLTFIVHLTLLASALFGCFIAYRNKIKTFSTRFSIQNIRTIRIKRVSKSWFTHLLPRYNTIVTEDKNGKQQKYRLHLDDISLDELIFELIDKNIRVETLY